MLIYTQNQNKYLFMKKLLTTLVLFSALLLFKGYAQTNTTGCNPDFTFQFLSGFTVKFNPTLTTDSPYVQHYWRFGDGSAPSNNISPTHTYAVGVYSVTHIVVKHNPNGVVVCTDSLVKQLTIGQVVCNLTAAFTSEHSAQLQVHFNNSSIGFAPGDSIRWTFGDGSVSYDVNPTHLYANAGSYNVCLRVKKASVASTTAPCVSELCHTVSVNLPPTPCNLQVYFITDSLQPNVIHFNNQSSGYNSTDSITWNFGDGTISHDINPTHTYTTVGTFNVCLVIKKPTIAGTTACVQYFCKQVHINLPPVFCNLTANFNWNRDSTGISIHYYHFTNTSTGGSARDSIRWTFGDGSSSKQNNPFHEYVSAGTYNVCIKVIKRTTAGILTNCVSEKCYTITIQQACNIQVNYTRTVSTSNYKTIYFTNTSNATPNNATATWYFGDGSTAATWNAEHTYSHGGTYYVCLRVQSGICVSYKCDSVRITEPTPACISQSAYSFVRLTTNNNIITFTPTNSSNDVQCTWTFGDGTGSQTTVTPTHQFAAIGYYTVCLTVFRSSTCASTTCKTIYVSSITNCSSITLNFNDVHDPLVPNRIQFVATSNTVITDQLWTITKIPATAGTGTANIHANNPTYVFLDSGYYHVCLLATYFGGCVKDFCKTIHIAHQMPFTTTCNLQVYPNPASTYANVIITLAQPTILYAYVYNSLNMLIAQKTQQGFVGTNTVSVPIANLPSGIYRFRLVHGNDVCNTTFIK